MAWLTALSEAQAQPPAGIYTRRYDNSRSGVNPNETILAPNNVNQTTFGLLFTDPVDAFVMAEPLYVPNVTFDGVSHNAVYVATENDSVYAFDANTQGAALSYVNLLGPGETTVPATSTCPLTVGQTYGIVGNPVIDPDTGTLYAVARSQLTTSTGTTYFTRLHALNISNLNGPELAGFPVVISGSVAGNGGGSVKGVISFLSQFQGQDAALLLAQNNTLGGKQLYIGFSQPTCGIGPAVHGWLFEYDATTGAQLAVFNSTPNASLGGIWAGRSGPAEDSEGEIYVGVANGDYNPTVGDYGDTELKFTPATADSKQLTIADSFTPSYECWNNVEDFDFGLGGPVLLPPQSTSPNLLVTEDKYGAVYLLDRDNLGGGPTPPPTCSPTQTAPTSPPECNIFPDLPECFFAIVPNKGNLLTSSPIFFNGNLYVDPWGLTPEVFAMQGGAFSTSPVATVPASQYLVGQKPEMSLSANGQNNALLWIYDDANFNPSTPSKSGQALLYAFDPTNLVAPVYVNNKPTGAANPGPTLKFAVPAEINGKVYMGTQNTLAVYGMLTTSPNPITLHGSQSSTADNVTAVTLTKPSGALAGDLLLAEIAAGDSTSKSILLTAPSGWTLQKLEPSPAGAQAEAIYWKIAGASEPSSYTWTTNTTVTAAGGIVAYGNVNTSSPFDVVSGGYFPTASNTISAPSLTTKHSNELLVVVMTAFAGRNSSSWTLPPGMKNEMFAEDGAADVSTMFLDQFLGIPAATGIKTASLQTAAPSAAAVLSIRDVGN